MVRDSERMNRRSQDFAQHAIDPVGSDRAQVLAVHTFQCGTAVIVNQAAKHSQRSHVREFVSKNSVSNEHRNESYGFFMVHFPFASSV